MKSVDRARGRDGLRREECGSRRGTEGRDRLQYEYDGVSGDHYYPSYKGQIVTMTYPLIGNYGVNAEDVESGGPKVEGFIAREFSKITSNHRAEEGLLEYLARHGIMAIEEVDTRALTKHLRARGVMKAMISTSDLDPESLVQRARESAGILGIDLVREVTSRPRISSAGTMGTDRRGHGFA